MPRRGQNQPPTAAPDQTYGVGGDQIAQQKQMPLPQTAGQPAPQMGGGGGSAGASSMLQSALAQATAMPMSPADLAGPSRHPNEPVTTGIGLGPGAGPAAMPPMPHARNHTADILDTLAQVRQSSALAALAARARGR